MKQINVKKKMNESGLLEIIAAVYSQKTGQKYDDILSKLNKKVDQKLNEIGEKLSNKDYLDEKALSELGNKSLEDFLKDKTVIKEE
jgi:hypothetical protein